MLTRMILIALALACFAAAQDGAPTEPKEAPDSAEPKKPDAEDDTKKKDEGRVVRSAKKDKIRVLKPKDVPGELRRLKSKADIKAEITVRTASGRPVVFKGVIRNGKLIERIVKHRFVPQKTLNHPRCGVRIWWSGGTDGFIFFRYSVIKSVAITGRLTDVERREIMRRLRAGRAGNKAAAPEDEQVDLELAKLTPAQLKAYLLKRYPYDKGWNHKKLRTLKRQKLIENKVLAADEEVFVQYFAILVEAHFEDLKRRTRKIEIEPGSETRPDSGTTDDAPPPEDEDDE